MYEPAIVRENQALRASLKGSGATGRRSSHLNVPSARSALRRGARPGRDDARVWRRISGEGHVSRHRDEQRRWSATYRGKGNAGRTPAAGQTCAFPAKKLKNR